MLDKYTFENIDNNEYLNQYNRLVTADFGRAGKSLHHIMPRCKYPELIDDKKNHAMLPYDMHWKAHYLLWKYSWEYALEFQFINNYFRKYHGFRITPEEEKQLQEDVNLVKRFQRESKKQGRDWVK